MTFIFRHALQNPFFLFQIGKKKKKKTLFTMPYVRAYVTLVLLYTSHRHTGVSQT